MNLAWLALFRAAYRLFRPFLVRVLERERNDGDANNGEALAVTIWVLDRLAGRSIDSPRP